MTVKQITGSRPAMLTPRTFNTFAKAANRVLTGGDQGGGSLAGPPSGDIVSVQNNSGADRTRFEVLGIDGPLIAPGDDANQFNQRVALKGVTPTHADHTGRFVVLLEPIDSGKVGRAMISGVTVARLRIEHGGEPYADVVDSDESYLQAGSGGSAQILYANGTGSDVEAIVRLGHQFVPMLGKLTGHAELTTHVWKYAWEEVVWNGDGVSALANGRSGTTSSDYALNPAEFGHTSQYVWNMDTDGDDYPEGGVAHPLGSAGTSATHQYDVLAHIWPAWDSSGSLVYRCTPLAGGHDGTCDAPA